MDNLNFSSSIELKINDARNAVMIDTMSDDVNGEYHSLHFYFLTPLKDEEGNYVYDENNEKILNAKVVTYKLDSSRNYREALSQEITEEQYYDCFTSKGNNKELKDIVSFDVKNLPGVDKLTSAYGYANLKNQKIPIYKTGTTLGTDYMTLKEEDVT